MARLSRIRGINSVRRGLNHFFTDTAMQKAERAMTEVLIIGMAKALVYTPIDKGLLINSSFRQVSRRGRKVIGMAGYTQNYAAALHDREGWRGRLNSNAGPKFLERGFEETLQQQQAAVRRIMHT